MNAPLHPLDSQPSPRRARWAALLRRWWRRASTRNALAELSPEQLRDIGITYGEALREARRPFWRGDAAQKIPEWWECPPVKRGSVVELEYGRRSPPREAGAGAANRARGVSSEESIG